MEVTFGFGRHNFLLSCHHYFTAPESKGDDVKMTSGVPTHQHSAISSLSHPLGSLSPTLQTLCSLCKQSCNLCCSPSQVFRISCR